MPPMDAYQHDPENIRITKMKPSGATYPHSNEDPPPLNLTLTLTRVLAFGLEAHEYNLALAPDTKPRVDYKTPVL